MRRPSLGRRIMHGVLLIWQKVKMNVEHGYVPHWWTPEDLQDVKAALKYLGKLYDWYVDFHGPDEHEEGDHD